jgi:hypothetical protein
MNNTEAIPGDDDVVLETEFNRDKLQNAISKRLKELCDIITSRKSKGQVEPWFADLVTKILLSGGPSMP